MREQVRALQSETDGRRIPYTEDWGQGQGITKRQIQTEDKHEEGCIYAHASRGDLCLRCNDNFRPDRKSTRSELQSHSDLVCRLLLEKKNNITTYDTANITRLHVSYTR